MPDARTTVTELVTGLGMLGHGSPEAAIAARPAVMASVSPEGWDDLARWCAGATHRQAFVAAFANGVAFLESTDALRGRVPLRIDWRGSTRAVDDDLVPADLRVDYVYLVSCKYLSNVLANASPARLFDGLLRTRTPSERTSWFDVVAPDELAALTVVATGHAGLVPVGHTGGLTRPEAAALKAALVGRQWPSSCQPHWQALVDAVAVRTAERWRAAITSKPDATRLLWRLLRIGPTPYYVLGAGPAGPLRLRVLTSWDWSQRYQLDGFEVSPRPGGQPMVEWSATVGDRDHGTVVDVAGHVEIRWSHGRLGGAPEAKVYLDSPHRDVPGYLPLS